MRVHFITSRPTAEKNTPFLELVLRTIEASGHVFANTTAGTGTSRKAPTDIEAIAKSDAVIAEVSQESFEVGYLCAVAVQQKKPLLLLNNQPAAGDTFMEGLTEAWVARFSYANDDEAVGAIQQFLNDNDIATKDMRFNFFIDRQIYNYLRSAAFKTGKTKAEILRELVQREIEKL
ncbi:MAG TPA: hypothetical protein VLF60_02510 [Candidatus Saccharimonadales bacterium]|nr:hypothetical protein [Candidatus Saccharimonadales bacterium]